MQQLRCICTASCSAVCHGMRSEAGRQQQVSHSHWLS
jgi:hypothetical protein